MGGKMNFLGIFLVVGSILISQSSGAIQYPATIKTEGGTDSGSALVDLRNFESVDLAYFTYEATFRMGSTTKITVRGSTADGNKITQNEQLPGESFFRVIEQKVVKSQDANGIHITVFITSTLKLAGEKEKYGKSSIKVRVASGPRPAHFWDIKHEYSNNYQGEDEGELCLGCDVKEEPACIPVGTVRPRVPFGSYDVDASGIPRSTLGSASVKCSYREVTPGKYQFACDGADPRQITLSTEHILWLCPPGAENRQLDIVVPNYRHEELIRAALKASTAGQTNVNILLKRPETVYDVQAQEGGVIEASKPSVNLQYEAVRGPLSVHYPVEQAYNPLSGPIREP